MHFIHRNARGSKSLKVGLNIFPPMLDYIHSPSHLQISAPSRSANLTLPSLKRFTSRTMLVPLHALIAHIAAHKGSSSSHWTGRTIQVPVGG